MGTYTEYKQLEKPLSTDKYNISAANKNYDIIDSELHKLDLKNESQDQLLATKESLNDEISRAQAKENEISTDLDNETLRAMASEDDLSNDISTETNRAVMAEETITEDLINHNISASAHSDIRDLISGLAVSGSVTLTNNLLATIAGTALDATQGKALNDKGEQMAFYKSEEDGMWHFRDWNGADTVIPFSGGNHEVTGYLVQRFTTSTGINPNPTSRTVNVSELIDNWQNITSDNFIIRNFQAIGYKTNQSNTAGSNASIKPIINYNNTTGDLTITPTGNGNDYRGVKMGAFDLYYIPNITWEESPQYPIGFDNTAGNLQT